MSEPVRHRFSLHQDGLEVATVESADRDLALREIMHYAMVYGRDGPVQVHGVNPDDWASLTGKSERQRRIDGAGNIINAMHGGALKRLSDTPENG